MPGKRLGGTDAQTLKHAGGVEVLTPGSRLLSSVSKMKVHPGIFMKTKEREKLLAPNARKEAWGLGRPNPAKGRGGCDPGSRLLSFVSKMKVHPGIFMKTKERENYTSQTPREMFGGSQGGTPAQSDGTPMDRGRQHAGFLPPLAVPPKLPRIIIGSSRREDEWNVPVRNPESPVRAARAELENRNLKFENRKWKLETRKPKLETRKWKPDFRIRQ